MGKLFTIIMTLFFALPLCGCAGLNLNNKDTATMRIIGSTSMFPLTEKLAGEYEKTHPGVRIYVQGGDSSLGLNCVSGGIAEIGSLSRPLTTAEKAGLDYYQIATDNIMIIVNPSLNISHIKLPDLIDIFIGKINNWKDVGGPDAPMTVITREQGSGTYNVFRDTVTGRKSKIADSALVMNSTGAVKTAVAGDKYAIGYISSRFLSDEVRPIPVDDGKSRTMLLSRPLIYITKKGADSTTMGFINYVLSVEGKAVINEFRLN